MIGVTLKGALKSGSLAVVPLDTCFVKPELEDVKSFCINQLTSFYPEDVPTGTCEVVGLESVLEKIKSGSFAC